MSNERHETIDDIVEMLRANARGDRFDDFSFTSLADRIEAAANHQFREVAKMIPHEEVDVSKMETTTPTRDKSSQVGNEAAMREALEQIRELLSIGGKPDTAMCIRYEAAYLIAKEALSVPPRNCDKYTLAESLRKYGFPTKSKPWGEKEWLDFCEWYISEAKGETDGSK